MKEMVRINVDILGISELKWMGMGELNSDDHYIYSCGQEFHRRNGVAPIINKRVWNTVLECSLKNDNNLGFFLKEAIQHHSNPSLCPYHWCWRSWSWSVLWRPRRPPRTHTKKGCFINHWVLKCKSRKSKDTWGNGQIWPWRTEWSRAKANWTLPREYTGHSKHPFQQHKRWLYTWTSPNGQYWNQYSL